MGEQDQKDQQNQQEQKEKIFREKSLEQLSSPEQLTSYLRVVGSGVWFALGGIIILLVGLLAWGMFGRIYTTVTVPAEVKDGKASCYILSNDIKLTEDEIEVEIGDLDLEANPDTAVTMTMDQSADPALYKSGYLSPGKNVVVLTCNTDLKDGVYDAVVTTETMKPLSLLFSKS